MTFIERLQNEQFELQTKIIGLSKFLDNDELYSKIEDIQLQLLHEQLCYMTSYNNILIKRINLLNVDIKRSVSQL